MKQYIILYAKIENINIIRNKNLKFINNVLKNSVKRIINFKI